MRMRKYRASHPGRRGSRLARMIGGFVASGGQDIPIHAAEADETSTACWKLVRDEKLVQGKNW